jgi:hypothetical protein
MRRTTIGGMMATGPTRRERHRRGPPPTKPFAIEAEEVPVSQRSAMETIKVEGGELLEEVRRLLHEGNVRRIVIKQGDRTVVEFPLTLGVVGAALAPPLAAVGAMAALLTDCSIEVERENDETRDASAPLPDRAGGNVID